jgi:hypothetical protein
VRVATPADRDLLERIRGQIADLDVEMTTDAAPLEATLVAQLARADALAKTHAAERAVVVWFTAREGGGIVLCVSEPAAGRVLVRTIGSTEQLSSAVLEQTALVVRNALRALAAGGTIGVERSVFEPPPPPKTPKPKPPAPVVPVREHGGAVGFGGVGAIAGLDGLFGTSAIWTWLGARWPSFDVRLEATFGVPTDAVASLATFHVARHTFALDASIELLRSHALDFALGARAGGIVYVRTTRDTDPSLTPAPLGVTGAGVLGIEARLRWHPAPMWAFVATAGVDFILGPPTFGVNAPTYIRLEEPAVVEPRVGLGIEFTPRFF